MASRLFQRFLLARVAWELKQDLEGNTERSERVKLEAALKLINRLGLARFELETVSPDFTEVTLSVRRSSLNEKAAEKLASEAITGFTGRKTSCNILPQSP